MIQCWNCNTLYSVTEDECPYCNSINALLGSSEEDSDADSCLDCQFFEPNERIQCKELATAIRWDRNEFEIDEPSAFKCGKWRKK